MLSLLVWQRAYHYQYDKELIIIIMMGNFYKEVLYQYLNGPLGYTLYQELIIRGECLTLNRLHKMSVE